MNNENLNDFYKQNRFNKKLRERIDSYEPELSDSLWDRIEHGLEKKESRSKRMVWMVYLMAGLLLISGAGLYYLATENKKLADAVNSKDQLVQKGPKQEAPAFEYQMPETTIELTPGPANPTENPGTAVHTQTPAGNEPENPNQLVLVEEVPEVYEVSPSVLAEVESVSSETGSMTDGSEGSYGDQGIIPLAGSINKLALRPFFYGKGHLDTRYLKEDISTKGMIHPKIQPYIGLTSELGSTRQKLEGSHAYRFGFEHPMLYRSNGIKLGIAFRNGIYMESGMGYSNSGTNIWYDSVERYTPPVPIPAPGDSLINGNFHTVNEQHWIDLPLQVGYRYRLNSKWALHGQSGLTYSMINSFSGVEPNEGFGKFDPAGESVPQPFKNYWSMNVGLGVGYQFARNWIVDVQGNYRRGLTEMNRETRPNHPTRTAEFLNAKVGIVYIFR